MDRSRSDYQLIFDNPIGIPGICNKNVIYIVEKIPAIKRLLSYNTIPLSEHNLEFPSRQASVLLLLLHEQVKRMSYIFTLIGGTACV